MEASQLFDIEIRSWLTQIMQKAYKASETNASSSMSVLRDSAVRSVRRLGRSFASVRAVPR